MSKLPSRHIKGFGWRPDTPDPRDYKLKLTVRRLPKSVDLRADMPPVYDQGDLGSCTANAIGAAIQYQRKKEGQPDFMPSRLFIYYNERCIEHTIQEDAGAEIRDGIKCVHKLGACPETTWGYDIKRFAEKPSQAAYNEAKADLVAKYARVTQTLSSLKGALSRGLPIVFGFSVPESFEGDQIAKDGIMHMPGTNESYVGGHAVLAVGYDDARKAFCIRNSWSDDWGDRGHFWMPYDFTVGSACSDFWTISDVT